MKIKTLVIGALGLLLISCNGSGTVSGPEGATQAYVSAIANANYENAEKVSTGTALETVEQMKTDSLGGYETKIVEVNCDVDAETETARCKCTERRVDTTIFLNYKYDSFVYDLEKIEGDWKVTAQTKDMAMPDFGDMGLGEEDMMEDMPMDEAAIADDTEHEGDDHDHEH